MDVGHHLPWLRAVTDDSGRPLNWRDARRSRVVFFTHPGACGDCARLAAGLLETRDALRRSDSDLWFVGDSVPPVTTTADDVRRVTGDAERGLRTRAGVSEDGAWLIVADRWGQVWQAAAADDRHTLATPADALETAWFIAVQCPECETLDQPTDDWSSVH